MAVQQHEEQHAQDGTCLQGVLAAIPDDVRRQAEAIGAYLAQACADMAAEQARTRVGAIFDPPTPDRPADRD